jgi:hypothetical protein
MLPIILVLVIVLGLCSNVQAKPIVPHIIFTYQSQGIPLNTWVELITTCLAPLLVHVAGGVSSITPFSSSSSSSSYYSNDPGALSPLLPSWTVRLPHFNPISIVWRYYAIADRRARAKE